MRDSVDNCFKGLPVKSRREMVAIGKQETKEGVSLMN